MRNKIQRTLIHCVVLFLAASVLQAQSTWTNTYGGPYDDVCHCVRQTSDGGYVAAGLTYSFGKAGQAYVLKTDSAGTMLWQKNYGLNPDDEAYSVFQTGDDGYLVAGWTKSYGPGLPEANVYLLKLDADGDTSWTKSYGGNGADYSYSARQTEDGGYIVAGSTTSWGTGAEDMLLIKFDAAGETLWTKTFGGSFFDEAHSVDCTEDGGYIVAGVTRSFGSGAQDSSNMYLVRTDSLGDTLWTRTYGDDASQSAWCVRPASTGYVVTGYHRPNGSMDADMYIVRINAVGDTLWSKLIGGTGHEDAYGIEATGDGGFIIVGHTSSYGAGGTDVYLVKTDSLGIVQWTRIFGGSQFEFTESIQLTADGGYITGGYTYSFGAGTPTYCNAYLIKTDGNGNVGVAGPWQATEPLTEYDVLRVWPNPYRERATIRYSVVSRGLIELRIYDIQGRLINIVQKGMREPGTYTLEWDGRGSTGQSLSAGIYFVRLSCGDRYKTRKIVKIQ